jgi:hypothetical protein
MEIEHDGIDGMLASQRNACCSVLSSQNLVALTLQDGSVDFQNLGSSSMQRMVAIGVL